MKLNMTQLFQTTQWIPADTSIDYSEMNKPTSLTGNQRMRFSDESLVLPIRFQIRSFDKTF